MSDSLQSQLAAIRQQRQQAFQKQQEAAEAARKAEADAKKLRQLLEKAAIVAAYPPVDGSARRIGRWVRRVKQKFCSNTNVVFAGETYSLEVADQMSQGGIPPFDIPEAQMVVNAAIRKQQEVEAVIAASRDGCGDVSQLMMTAWMNLERCNLENKRFPECLMDLMVAVGIVEPEELMRRPFASKEEEEKNAIAFWFRVFMHSQGDIPAWVGGTSEEWMTRAEMELIEKLSAYNEKQQKEQLRMMQQFEEMREPTPDEEVQCTNGDCNRKQEARLMYRKEGGSFFFCRNCAPFVGIDVPPVEWDEPASPAESPILPPIDGSPRSASPLSWGDDLEPAQDI